MFQSTVNTNQAFGIIGEIYKDGTRRAQPGIIDSVGTTNPNRVGRAFTNVAGADGHMTVGGTGVFAGILANPKVYPERGTAAGGTLAPSLDLPQYAQGAEFVYGTTGLIVYLENAGNIGDTVDYDTTTGQLYARGLSADSAGAQRIAFASNVATVTLAPAGMPPIGVGSIIVSGGKTTVVTSLGTGTGGNGTYNVGTVTDQAATAFSFTTPASVGVPAGRANIRDSSVVFFSTPAAGLAVIELNN